MSLTNLSRDDLSLLISLAKVAVNASAAEADRESFLADFFLMQAAEAKVRGKHDGASLAIADRLAEMANSMKDSSARLQSLREKAEAEIAAMERLLPPSNRV